jgi:hypothetical protein
MKITRLAIIVLFFTATLFSSCKKTESDNLIICYCEQITTVQYTLTPENGGDPVVFTYFDEFSTGIEPIITGGTLSANQTYKGRIEFFDDSGSLPENLSKEISSEAAYYQFFFNSTIPGIEVSYDDMDENGNPLGIESILTTSEVGDSGTLTITLRVEPDKYADGATEGNIENVGGETDIEISFPIIIE